MSKIKRGYLDNPRAQRELQELEDLVKAQRDSDFKTVMATPCGRRGIWYILQGICGVMSSSWTGTDETFYREGRRSVGIELIDYLQQLVPNEYVLMVTEQVENQKELRLQSENAKQKEYTDE